MIVTLFVMVIAFILVEIFLPTINLFIGYNTHLSIYNEPFLLVFLILLALFSGFVSGFYPAIIVSRFQPLKALGTRITSHSKSVKTLKNGLVILQFLIAQVLIISTLVISGQVKYLQNKNLGFKTSSIYMIPLPDAERRDVLRNELLKLTAVESLAFGGTTPQAVLDDRFTTDFSSRESDDQESYECDIKAVDEEYGNTFGLDLLAGEWPTTQYDPDTLLNLIVNEEAIQKLGYKDPVEAIGKRINIGRIQGVVKNFHLESLHAQITPVVMVFYPRMFGQGFLEVGTEKHAETMQQVELIWQKIFPEQYFSYQSYDSYIAQMYKDDNRIFDIVKLFSTIAIIIACLGLFGLISYMVIQKMREVSIRKVLGASVEKILVHLSSGYIKLILLSNLIAIPLGWYIMKQWLERFAYRIEIHWWIFAIAFIFSLVVAMVTILYHVVKTASASPVESLKYE